MQKTSIIILLRSMMREYWPLRKNLYWLLPVVVFIAAAQIIEPYIYKQVIDVVTTSGDTTMVLSGLLKVLIIWISVMLLSI